MKYLTTIILTGLLAVSTSVIAHTGIKSTSPTNEQVLNTSPEKLILTFKGSVRLMKVVLLDSEEETLETDFKPSAKAGKTFDIGIPSLTAGNYAVHWTSMGKDGHKIKGDFSFKISTENKTPGDTPLTANIDTEKDDHQKNEKHSH